MATTPKLDIPKPALEGLAELLSLKQDQFDSLDQALQGETPTFAARDLASRVQEKTGLSADVIDKVLNVLIGLNTTRLHYDMEMSDLLANVCQSMAASGEQRYQPSNGNWDDFKSRLSQLLRIQSIGITSKTLDVLRDHQHAYITRGGRVLTDIRPIFTDELSPKAAVIIHELKIRYWDLGPDQVSEFRVAMDDEDIKHLRDTLDRAEKKARQLREVLQSTTLQYIGPEETR